MPKDLRTFLAYLEENQPDDLVKIHRQVDPLWETAAVLRRFREDRAKYGYPSIWFQDIKGCGIPGMTMYTNMMGARTRLAAMLETTVENSLNTYIERETRMIPPKEVASGPVHENVRLGDQVDLTKWAIPCHAEKDGGDLPQYIGGDLMIMKNPVTGVENGGCYRLQQKGKNRFGVSLGTHTHAYRIMVENEKHGRDTEVAIVLGHHPALVAGTQSRVPDYVSEMDAIGGLMQEPVEVVKAKTVDLMVPARAELVIEGRIPCKVREMEGPFGEYPMTYGPARMNPTIEISAITYRNNPIFYDLNNAYVEHNLTAVLAIESQIYRHIRSIIPTVKKVRMPESGCCRFLVFVQMEKIIQGQGTNAALVALGAESFLKMAVVVDADIDISDDDQVWWAVITRSQATNNWFFIPNAHCQRLLPIGHSETNPFAPGMLDKLEGLDTKIGIDATLPLSYPFSERQDVRKADWENLDLQEYLGVGARDLEAVGDD